MADQSVGLHRSIVERIARLDNIRPVGRTATAATLSVCRRLPKLMLPKEPRPRYRSRLRPANSSQQVFGHDEAMDLMWAMASLAPSPRAAVGWRRNSRVYSDLHGLLAQQSTNAGQRALEFRAAHGAADERDFGVGHPSAKTGVQTAPKAMSRTTAMCATQTSPAGCQQADGSIHDDFTRSRANVGSVDRRWYASQRLP